MLHQRSFAPYGFIVPALILVVLVVFIPNILTIFLAFTNYSLYHFEDYSFVGFANFKEIFLGVEARVLFGVLGWTIVWAGVSVLLSLILGLTLAWILHNSVYFKIKGPLQNFLRTILIIPWALPNFITVLIWHGLLNTHFGFINHFLGFLGLSPVPWLEGSGWAKIAVLLVNLWLGFPFMMSVCLGALQSIPKEVYEAAEVDGASLMKQFYCLTLPLLKSSLIPVLISSFAFQFNQFNVIYLLTDGGPPLLGSPVGSTDILVTYAYKLAFDQFRFGLSCAYGVLIFLVVALLSMGNFLATGGFHEDGN